MTTVDVLQAARGKVHGGWSQRTSARDATDLPVRWDTPEACRFCVMGAVAAVCNKNKADVCAWREPYAAALAAMTAAMKEEGITGSLAAFNDAPTTSKQQVLNLFDMAIRLARPV